MLEGMLTNGSPRLTINKQDTPLDVKVMSLDIKVLCLGIKYLDIKVCNISTYHDAMMIGATGVHVNG